jgi:inositol-pentakisphosphate 2-kinase
MNDSQAADCADVSSYSLAEVPVTHFSYVAEGGANLVVAYTGENYNSFLQGSVLRIRKKIHDAPSLSETALKEEDASVAFTDGVVVPLLPEHATPRLLSIPVHNKEWLRQLAEHVQYSRPLTRRDVDDIDVDRGYVVLADNLVGTASDDSMSIAVEIKVGY